MGGGVGEGGLTCGYPFGVVGSRWLSPRILRTFADSWRRSGPRCAKEFAGDSLIPEEVGMAVGKVAVTLPEELYEMVERARPWSTAPARR